MKVKILKQIILPVIIAFLLSAAVFYYLQTVLCPRAEKKGNDYVELIDYQDSGIQFSNEDFYNIVGDITKEEAAKLTSLVIDCTRDMDVDVLNLSDLQYFPNVCSITLIGGEFDVDSEETYYYEMDIKNLEIAKQIKSIRLERFNVRNLSYLRELKLHDITFADCRFNGLPKEQYSYLSGISSVAFQGLNTGLNLQKLFVQLDEVKELDVSGLRTIENGLLDSWKPLASLEGLTFSVSTSNIEEYRRILTSCPKLKKLGIIYQCGEVGDKNYELKEVADLSELEELTLIGCSDNKNLCDYVEDSMHTGETEKNRLEYENGEPYEFDLYKNSYHDYSYLSKLTNLRRLTMQDMEITDVSFLKNYRDLTYADLSYNFIHDIMPLQELTSLEELNLSFNGITDTTALLDLINIRNLSLRNNNITKLDCVGNMKNLKLLDIASGFYWLDNPEYEYENLYRRYYHNQPFENDFYMRPNRGYKPVSFEGQYVADTFYTVESSWVTYQTWTYENPFDDMYFESYVTLYPYQTYSIWGTNRNKIESINSTKGLTKLEFLDISGNNVNDISGVSELDNLRFFGCMDNRIESVEGITISNLPNLQYLYISQNPIVDGENVAQMRDCLQGLDYYMTPYYNRTKLGMVEKKDTPLSLDIMNVDVAMLFRNLFTRGE